MYVLNGLYFIRRSIFPGHVVNSQLNRPVELLLHPLEPCVEVVQSVADESPQDVIGYYPGKTIVKEGIFVQCIVLSRKWFA